MLMAQLNLCKQIDTKIFNVNCKQLSKVEKTLFLKTSRFLVFKESLAFFFVLK